MKLNVLVTGCGGDIGQSIGKILSNSEYVLKLVGCDISDKNPAQFIYDTFLTSLPCSDDKYLTDLKSLIKLHEIDLIIPASEPEIRFFSKKNITSHIGKSKLICANKQSLKTGFDKLSTAKFLEENKLPFPVTESLATFKGLFDFPFVVKSRTGSGSSNVYIVKDIETLDYLKTKSGEYIAQEYLPEDKGEYTCGLFRSSQGIIRSIIFKRSLTGGYSSYGEVIHNKEIKNLLIEIAHKISLEGSINVQLRLTIKGPIIFEINPRFSSTVLFRHLFGFKDLLWSIEDKMNMDLSEYIGVASGRKFYKGFNEYIV